MNTSGIVQQPDMRNLLELPQDEMMQELQRVGAMNSSPPLVRSSHLKNKDTGMVFAWNPLLAEQRDIMVNCDINGNTDPEAWEPTVDHREYSTDERDAAYWAARDSVVRQAMDMSGTYVQSLQESSIPQTNRVPGDVQPLDQYYSKMAKDVQKLNDSLEF